MKLWSCIAISTDLKLHAVCPHEVGDVGYQWHQSFHSNFVSKEWFVASFRLCIWCRWIREFCNLLQQESGNQQEYWNSWPLKSSNFSEWYWAAMIMSRFHRVQSHQCESSNSLRHESVHILNCNRQNLLAVSLASKFNFDDPVVLLYLGSEKGSRNHGAILKH